MTSIRARLFFILMITTGVVWMSAIAWIYLSTRVQVEHALDARLTEAARMVSSLMTSQQIDTKRAAQMPADPAINHTSYDRQLSCQIWAFDGTLVGRSDGAPTIPLSEGTAGFSQTDVDGETWRVYAVENKSLGMRVMVGDNLKVRDRLVTDVVKGLLLPALLILPILAGLIWFSVRRGLSPLSRMAVDLEKRPASDLSALPDKDVASEIRPMIGSLNGLFGRVVAAREHERNFTAFAAHELRTPIAGLKTQAQVALASYDDTIRDNALRQIIVGVDRTSRLVRQLTDLTAAEASETSAAREGVDVAHTLEVLLGELQTHASPRVKIMLDSSIGNLRLDIEPALFMMAARNLLENALLHSPQGGTIRCWVKTQDESLSLIIDDDGPGIPDDELSKVRDRFFRGRHKTAIGSGLGLAIVELALQRAGCALCLSNRQEGGLRAEIKASCSLERQADHTRENGRSAMLSQEF